MQGYFRTKFERAVASSIGVVASLGFLFSATAAVAAMPQDPPSCDSTGVGISMTVFRADGTTPFTGTQRAKDGEAINYRATLSYQGGTVCAFQGGVWHLTTPDGVVHDITPGGGVPEIGGAGVPSLNSALVPYTVNHANEGAGNTISATTDYSGSARDGADSPVTASTGISRTIAHAKISITPTGTNEINHQHVFTAHVDVDSGSGFAPAADGTQISVVKATGPGTITGSPCTTAGGTGSCTVTDNSATPGVDTVNASSNVTIGGTTISVTTNGSNGNSGSVTKTWVDANIQITPAEASNKVGDPHTLTVHVNVNTGTGGYVSAPDGTLVNLSIDSGPGSLTSPTCTTSGGTGSCTDTLNSAVTGTTVVSASTDVSVGGVSLHRTTNGSAGNSGPATKHWVSAKISITPDGTNEINHKHIFTAHVDVDNGSGFANAPDGTITGFSKASGPGTFDTPTCTTSGGTGSCTDGLTSPTAGVTVVNASSTVTVNAIPISVTTNGTAGNSGPATKTWVDANIQVAPAEDTDPVGDNHILTAHVNVNTGTGGYVSAPDGTSITLAIVSGPGSFTTTNPCTTSGGTGSCSVTLTSAVVGTTVVSATTDVVVGGVTLHRTTDGLNSNSANATKNWQKIDSNIVTTIHDAQHQATTTVNAGSSVHDSATVSGSGPTPTGTVDFTFYNNGVCEGQGTAAGSVALSGGIADPSNTEGPLSAGSYSFKAHYNGDGTYNPSDALCEPLGVNKIASHTTTEIHNAAEAVITSADAGTTVHDKATVTGSGPTPTGTVTFTFFSGPGALVCDAQSVGAGTVALDGSGVAHPSNSEGPLAAGSYGFRASYSGDTNYDSSVGACEPLTINKVSPQISTTPSAGGPVGTVLNDTATVSGGNSPTGSVTFKLYAPGDNSCQGPAVYTDTDTSAPYATSPGYTSLVVGTYHWTADYLGDVNNNPASSGCEAEPVTTNKLDSNTVTEIHNASHAVITSAAIGDQVHDKATVSGSGATPTGSVSFQLYSDVSCQQTNGAPQVVALSGGSAETSATTAGVPGLSYKASYGGDSLYNSSVGQCEPLTVAKNQPTVATQLATTTVNVNTPVHDSATLSGATADAGGTATYNVYAGSSCSGTPVFTSGQTVTNGLIPNSGDFTPTAAGTYNWQVVYSGDSKNTAATSACQTEVLTVNQPQAQYCSPGYWKQPQHFASYNGTGFTPDEQFSAVFENAFPGMTLVQVLSQGGGGLNMLGRAAVGALMNSASLQNPLSTAQVISIFNNAFPGTKSQYEAAAAQFTFPENCPLN